MADITTLVSDMYKVLTPSNDGGVGAEVLKNFGDRMTNHVKQTFDFSEDRDREAGVIYASEVGERCTRKLYYKLTNTPQESIAPHTHYKFLYGDIVEEVTLLLAEASGHRVENTQEKVVATFGSWQVRGRIDATIDGVPVDVKSMSQYGFANLPRNLDTYDDSFGYVPQVSFYRNYRFDSEQVGILGVDKSLGHIKLSLGHGTSKRDMERSIEETIKALDAGLPKKGYESIPDGKSGNMKLGVACSYCPFKAACWPGLRTFIYSKGPVFLEKVVKVPDVPELLNSTGDTHD